MKDIILASSSKRREEILNRYNIKFETIKSNIIENIDKGDCPKELVMSLAFRKAYSVAKGNPKSIVIGADTIVTYKNEILSKPRDREDAFRMLSLLSGKIHEVMTGISIINLETNQKVVDFETTKVKFRCLNEEIINTYIDTKEPFDKAGSYGIQGIGALLVEKINGCYLNVVGLPIVKLDELFDEFFNIKIMNMNK